MGSGTLYLQSDLARQRSPLTGLTNGLSEGINNVIKAIKRRSYGYCNKERFTLRIYQEVELI